MEIEIEPFGRPTYRSLRRVSIQEQRKLKKPRKQQLQLARRTSACCMGGSGATKRQNNLERMEVEQWMRSRSKKFTHHKVRAHLKTPQT
jgi:hypothetical protein